MSIPEIVLSNGENKCQCWEWEVQKIFLTPEVVISAMLDAIEHGYRLDTAALYQTELPLGEAAISQSLDLGLIKSRDELFITSKLFAIDAHGDHVIPTLKKTLQ